ASSTIVTRSTQTPGACSTVPRSGGTARSEPPVLSRPGRHRWRMTMDDARPVNFDLTAALHDAEERFAAANPNSAAAYEAACRAMPGGNTRTVLYYPPFPLSLAGGEGCYVEDVDGHRYVDFVTEQTAGLYGHSNPVIKAAVTEALEHGITLGGPTAREAELAALLCERFPALELVRFTNSGTEANLLALSAARAFTGRPKIM